MAIEIKDKELKEMFEHGLYFHGHLCPAMPLGLRAGLLALRTLGVGRSQDKELMLLAETAEGHAMACFLDGLMMATGCTYGKGNVKKLRYGKLAFTLIDRKGKRQVRVNVKGEFVLNALKTSPFIAKRKAGVPPQEVEREMAEMAVNKIIDLPEEELFNIGEVTPIEPKPAKGTFEAYPCEGCGEAVYAKWIRVKDKKFYCIPCSGYKGNKDA